MVSLHPSIGRGIQAISSSMIAIIKLPIRIVALVIATFIGLFLPNRSKRIILAGSLYSHLKNVDTDHISEEQLKAVVFEMNRILNLTGRDERALMMPIMLHRAIWSHHHIQEKVDNCSTTPLECYDEVIDSVPGWLRYDSKAMADDIRLILTWTSIWKRTENV